MTTKFLHSQSESYIRASEEIIPFVQGELQYFRERMRPVIFCNTIQNGSVIRELSPRIDEICIEKSRSNAFMFTNLNIFLKEKKVVNLTIVGVQLYNNILLTAAAALEQGFSVVVPETCVCSDSEQDHQAALRLFNRWSKEVSLGS